MTAVRQAARGSDALLAPAVTRRLIQRFAGTRPVARPSAAQLNMLTSREMDVLRQVARGMSNAEIAACLFIAETTVKTHIARLLMKLGLRDRLQAVIFAYETGLIQPGDAYTDPPACKAQPHIAAVLNFYGPYHLEPTEPENAASWRHPAADAPIRRRELPEEPGTSRSARSPGESCRLYARATRPPVAPLTG